MKSKMLVSNQINKYLLNIHAVWSSGQDSMKSMRRSKMLDSWNLYDETSNNKVELPNNKICKNSSDATK